MYMKIHETKDGKIVAACDKELIGKVLEDKNGAWMDLAKYKDFYCGSPADPATLKKALVSFSSINLVGEKTVAVAVKERLIDEKDVKYIKGIPYIQIYSV